MTAGLSLGQQAALVRRWFPGADVRIVNLALGGRALVFETDLRPTPTSDSYRVRFCFKHGERPHVYVLNPAPVESVGGMRTPHLNYDGTLCLYDQAAGEWSESDAIINTVVHWTSRWLFHYEHWLAFHEWRGDGEPAPGTSSAGHTKG